MQAKKKKSNNKKYGRAFIIVGVLLIAGAIALYGYNFYQDKTAQATSEQLIENIYAEIPEIPIPVKKMPEKNIMGNEYCGFLSIPALDLKLPVMSQWDYSKLKTSPCRYYGWTSTDDLVIAAHNYKSQFGRMTKIKVGDEVVFTDMYGNVNNYRVADIERLLPNDVDKMINSNWDLSLYTCTYGAAQRITVRCQRSTE